MGGGWAFLRNFKKAGEMTGLFETAECSSVAGGWDVGLIPGATMITRRYVEIAHLHKKPVFLRVNGIPEDWRNRGTGTTRLRDYANSCDGIIYQSHFSKRIVGGMLGKDGAVVHNGVDLDVFNPKGAKVTDKPYGKPTILFVHHRGDPNKRLEECIAMFREVSLENKEAVLWLVGNYPKDYIQYNFGFFNNEKVYYCEAQKWEELAKYYRSADVLFYPSYADWCPNVVLEALASGCPVLYNGYGGTKELVGPAGQMLDPQISYNYSIMNAIENKEEARKRAEKFSLKKMAENYVKAFKEKMK